MRVVVGCAAVAAALVLSACGGGGSSKSTAGTPASASATKAPATTATPVSTIAVTPAPPGASKCATTRPPAANPTPIGGSVTQKFDKAPPMTIDVNKTYCATIRMDIGDIRIQLFAKDAPETVNSFVFLAEHGFYDGVTFHRVLPGFVAQAGDPTGMGRGGPGYTIRDEVNVQRFLDGTVGMAKTAAPNSAGSQFFIDYAPQPSLDGKYTAFGQVVAGRDVLDKIMPRDPASAPPSQPGTKINTIVIDEQ